MISQFEESPRNGQASANKREVRQQLSLAENTIGVIGVHISKSKLKLKVGQEDMLLATVFPHNASNQTVHWASNRPEVVEVVQNGRTVTVKGKQPGRAILVVTTDDGKLRDICIVNVHTYLTRPN